MAITNNGTKVSLKAELLPSGYTLPTVTTISDFQYQRTLELNVLKATVESATPATTLTNIIGNATIGITKQITDILALDYLGTATVTAYAELYDVDSNIQASTSSDFYNNTAVSYVCKVRLFVKAV